MSKNLMLSFIMMGMIFGSVFAQEAAPKNLNAPFLGEDPSVLRQQFLQGQVNDQKKIDALSGKAKSKDKGKTDANTSLNAPSGSGTSGAGGSNSGSGMLGPDGGAGQGSGPGGTGSMGPNQGSSGTSTGSSGSEPKSQPPSDYYRGY